MSPAIPPAVVVEESADKVTVVLAAAAAAAAGSSAGSSAGSAAGMLQAGLVGVGCVPVVAVEAETVPVVAVGGAAEAPVWILGSWTGPVIRGVPGNLAAAEPDWEDPAAGRRGIGQIVGLRLGSMGAETVETLGMCPAVAPETVGEYGAADRVVLPGCAAQKSTEGGFALGMVSGHPVVLVGPGSMEFAAGLSEESGQTGCNMVPGPESHSLLVLAVHKIPSVDHTACYPCCQGTVLAFPLGIAEDLQGHNPGQGNRAPVVELWEAPAATADCMDCLLRMVGPSFFPLGP